MYLSMVIMKQASAVSGHLKDRRPRPVTEWNLHEYSFYHRSRVERIYGWIQSTFLLPCHILIGNGLQVIEKCKM